MPSAPAAAWTSASRSTTRTSTARNGTRPSHRAPAASFPRASSRPRTTSPPSSCSPAGRAPPAESGTCHAQARHVPETARAGGASTGGPPFSSCLPADACASFRFCHRDDEGTLLVFADGACLSNGQAEPRGAWAFVDGEDGEGRPATLAGRLERRGPFGEPGAQTNNRAELRAVLAALRARPWPADGFHTLVVATDSEYVVEGATAWARAWAANARRAPLGAGLKNRDLWRALLGAVEQHARRGLAVQLWRIPRAWNADADAAAKEAAATRAAAECWVDAPRRRE